MGTVKPVQPITISGGGTTLPVVHQDDGTAVGGDIPATDTHRIKGRQAWSKYSLIRVHQFSMLSDGGISTRLGVTPLVGKVEKLKVWPSKLIANLSDGVGQHHGGETATAGSERIPLVCAGWCVHMSTLCRLWHPYRNKSPTSVTDGGGGSEGRSSAATSA